MFSPSASRMKTPASAIRLTSTLLKNEGTASISTTPATMPTHRAARAGIGNSRPRIVSRSFMSVSSCFVPPAGSEQPGGLEHQDQDQDAEDDHVGPLLGEVARGHAENNPDQEPAHRRPGDVADATEHRRGEGDDPGTKAKREVNAVVVEAVDDAAGAGQGGADEEGGGVGAMDVNGQQMGWPRGLR